MSEQIRVRLYNVLFGDAILVSVPDEDEAGAPLTRHVLIDVGNALAGAAGSNDVFAPVISNIAAEVGERGVDLYVMTHEHLDHVQGLPYAARLEPPLVLPVHSVWLTASANPDYYQRFPHARKQLDAADAVLRGIERHLQASGEPDAHLTALLALNHPISTAEAVRYLREELTSAEHVHYVHRGFDTAAAHPFRRANFRILAPEEDTASYYGRFRPMALGADASLGMHASADVIPPRGVDATAFYSLIELRAAGTAANAFAIDRARNNTSVVFTLHWRDRVLLFAGDAEERSWQMMQPDDLVPVDFLKVGHHGSHNGTPGESILERILPVGARGADRPVAAVSTHAGAYSGVPHEPTLQALRERCARLVSTADGPLYQDIFI